MERGVRRSEIFQDDFDKRIFLEILRDELNKNGCKLHAYCLMSNHFHFLLETGEIEIGKFMKGIACKYAMQYNHRYSFKGHVFEDRYRSCLVETDEYFLQVSRYIHLNPVKARMSSHPGDYRWSSFGTLIGVTDDKLTNTEKTLSYFKHPAVQRYQEFVEDIGHKYIVEEGNIRKSMGEDELWLPW